MTRTSRNLLSRARALAFDASKLFEWNWGVPQFRKRLHVPISIHLNFRQITALLYPNLAGELNRLQMSLENLFTQTTREAPSAPLRETFIAPMLLPVCCLCGLIRDDTRFPPGLDCWLTQRTYRETNGVDPSEIAHTHTYCPECFTKVQETVRQYFRKIGSSP